MRRCFLNPLRRLSVVDMSLSRLSAIADMLIERGVSYDGPLMKSTQKNTQGAGINAHRVSRLLLFGNLRAAEKTYPRGYPPERPEDVDKA